MELLERLSNAAGTPGNEGEVRQSIRDYLEGVTEFSYDKLGCILCKKTGSQVAPIVMLAGHMDEVGFIVRLITDDGFIKFHTLGGWWNHTMLAQQVLIKTAAGDVPGVIGARPVHHLSQGERRKVMEVKDMYIDVGATSKQEAMEGFGIFPGDHIVPATRFARLKNTRVVSGKAFDDRVGAALMAEALKVLAPSEHPNTIYGVGTVQEEIGSRGAKTAADIVNPDVALVLEGSPADDTPGFDRSESQCVMGNGPQIRVFDPTMIPNRAMIRFVLETAEQCGIPYQVAVRTSGGTDGRVIHVHRNGVPTIVMAPPVRYIHGHVSLLNLDDYDNTLKLLIELLKRLDADTVASFTAF